MPHDLQFVVHPMASSSIGIVEIPYTQTPFQLEHIPLKHQLIKNKVTTQPIYIFSGICSENDIIRGEETLLIGSDFSDNEKTVVILPGTHSKHIFVQNNSIYSIKTYMTGEFFELLSKKSVLSATIRTPKVFEEQTFQRGVADSISTNLLHQAFQVRTQTLLNGISHETNYHYLSGLLIGAELKELQNYDGNIRLISGKQLLGLYETAIKVLDIKQVTFEKADNLLLRGHCKLLSCIEKQQLVS